MKVDRRQFAQAAVSLGAGLVLGGPAWAQVSAAEPAAWEQAVAKILGGAKPGTGKIILDIPEIAENGNTVPFTLSVDSPMTDKDYVRAIHLISTGNPQPGIGSFFFTPESGRAAVSSRMRLGRTQDVVAIAALSEGRFLMAKRNVKVTIGGCGG